MAGNESNNISFLWERELGIKKTEVGDVFTTPYSFELLKFFLNHVNVLLFKTLDQKYTYLKKRSYKWPEATEKMFRTSVSFLSFSLCKLLVKLGIKK